ncbi:MULTISPECIES: HAD-IIA family hydrolase [Rhodococcus]|uniref:HAD-IIA family hydrolase n=1 Tax=Rhodococcus TaxID=1827 RepID=UPI000C7D488F|nr:MULTISPECIES: HAD-IIA family hydrolase [Rhodococcus]AUM15056.1 HAD family hydrolase [Rhodococcus ruber]MBD8053034.1 HAD-IIA family hydrolase [Rhodococcus ruber]MCF8782629.1 HAD-IIA family hydrolase [Rhodococcus ruber]QDC14816.1 HAD-IIA family hydrolase [Rhodococcus ruber]
MTGTRASLRTHYDVLLLDLDGTVYRGAEAVPGAREALSEGAERLFYVTNNASRRPGEVAKHLRELGFAADESSVVTSSQSAARLLAERVPAGAPVLVVGTEALVDEVAGVGLVPVRSADADPVAVVQGHSPETGWAILAEATLALRSGALWVATNIDSTLPTERGLVLGNGSMVAALRSATGREPLVAGKPAAPLIEDAVVRSGASRPLVVGDRLDTDIAGANAVGVDSLLVLTGVSTVADLLRAPAEQRPTYVADSLASLDGEAAELRPGTREPHAVSFDGRDVHLAPQPAADPMAALRAVLDVAWSHPGFGRVVATDDLLARWGMPR